MRSSKGSLCSASGRRAALEGARRASVITGVRDASEFAKHCSQAPSPFGSVSNIDENCLYLKRVRPTSAGPHPVMFWIHGGAFFVGQGDDYDPTNLVAAGDGVVTINYRLGPRFHGDPALTAEGDGASETMVSWMQLALHWCRAHRRLRRR